MSEYSTVEVARIVGVDKTTLLRWLYTGKLREPRRITHAGQDLRLWTEGDLNRVKQYKHENYRKGRGRKKTV
jgi:predicted site-specific integrase-resolvase